MGTGAATIALALVFYASLVATIELLESWRERRKARSSSPSSPSSSETHPKPVAIRRRDRNTPRVTVTRPAVLDFVWTTLAVAAAAGASFALYPDTLASEDVVMLYLAAIMIAAVRFGRAAAVVGAALSVATYDFFFVPPRYTFFVASSRHLVTFAMMFAVGITLATLARRLKRQSIAVALRGRSEEMKTALLSAVSHDLRTPLAAITGAATTLRTDEARDDGHRIPVDERRALLDTIADEGFHLERLVANLLDMTRIESGALRLKREWIPLEELVGSALARTEARFAGRPVRTKLDDGARLVHVDGALFELVLVNLLDNAAKHTPPTSSIEISTKKRDGGVDLVVADDGPGVPDGVDVFERFVRGPQSKTGGVGLGLAIARGIVELHGGTIDVVARDDASLSSPHGAAFRIALPITDAPPRVPDAPEAPG